MAYAGKSSPPKQLWDQGERIGQALVVCLEHRPKRWHRLGPRNSQAKLETHVEELNQPTGWLVVPKWGWLVGWLSWNPSQILSAKGPFARIAQKTWCFLEEMSSGKGFTVKGWIKNMSIPSSCFKDAKSESLVQVMANESQFQSNIVV